MDYGFSWRGALRLPALLLAASLLASCARLPEALPGPERTIAFTPNDFDGADVHTRHLRAAQAPACEAARRALLSQGYIVEGAAKEDVRGRKYYQPTPDVHYEVQMRVVCAPEGQEGDRSSVFASAVQDRYVIKKVNNSASVGVGGLGSLSLPLNSTDDTLVKVGSETISDAQFYARFFDLFQRYLPAPAPVARTSDVKVRPVAQPEAAQQGVEPLPVPDDSQ
ncbi:DUF2242 domain-containing protein [Comamonas badia]|uniref:DUF2242 domain-containing protein n=1 Tax=Comamonas badia TaxID=265291 RepID=UPI0004097A00|nr:DUF2242 domain-containing protein [Comamonas badia]